MVVKVIIYFIKIINLWFDSVGDAIYKFNNNSSSS